MIRLSETKTLDNYFIDENAVITDENGTVQHQYLRNGRPCFKGQYIHKIMMNTFFGYRDGHEWNIHHLDENPLNNKLLNLIYLTRVQHSRLHNIGEKNNNYGKHHSEKTKAKIRAAKLGEKNPSFGTYWWNNGIKNIKSKGFVAGRLKWK